MAYRYTFPSPASLTCHRSRAGREWTSGYHPRVTEPLAPAETGPLARELPPDLQGRRPHVWWFFAALLAGLLAFQVYVIFLQPHGLPDTDGHETRTTGEIAGPVVVRQSFQMKAGGLDAITIHARPAGGPTEGQAVVQLSELTSDESAPQLLFRDARSAASIVTLPTYTWRFQPIDASRDKRYMIEISLPLTPAGRGLSLLATRDEHYPAGRFWFDGREQWGDLVFSTDAARATSFRRFEHALRDKPAWLRSRWTLGALFVLYNVALAVILWTVLTAPLEPLEAAGGSPASPISARRRWMAAALLVAGAGAAYFWLVPQPFRHERGSIDLLALFPEATKRTTMLSLIDAFHYQTVTRESRRLSCVLAHPSSRITWTLDVPANAELRGFAGLRPDTWFGGSDGAVFRAGVSDGTTYEQWYRRDFKPGTNPADRVMAPFSIDLSKYAGRRVDVIFNTEPGELGSAYGDAALWCEPRIVALDR